MSLRPWSHGTEVKKVLTSEEMWKGEMEKVLDVKLYSQLSRELCKTAYYNKVHSISAPQVGINIRMFVFQSITGHWITCFNPSVTRNLGSIAKRNELCCSSPKERGLVGRNNRITVQYFNMQGKLINATLTELDAAFYLHELDHLNGKGWKPLEGVKDV